MQTAIQNLVRDQEITKSQHLSEIETLQSNLGKAHHDVEALERANDTQRRMLMDRDQEIDQLKLQLVYFHKAGLNRKSDKPIEAQQTITSTDLTLEGIIYNKIPNGPNAGKYVEENRRIVHYDGKTYDEYKVLHKSDLDVAGENKGKQIEMDGVGFVCFDEDGTEKYVSMIGPQSIVMRDGQQFIQWIVRKEIIKKANYRI